MKKDFKVCSIFDTETCNYGTGADTRAFPILYIFNDIKDIDLNNYQVDISDNVVFYRYENDCIKFIDNLINWGNNKGVIPVITAYNLLFDLQTILWTLRKKYKMNVNAQSGANIYTLDLVDSADNILLRFWDCFHLEMNGLNAMGKICGLDKAQDSWDYSLVRTPETPLTDEELFYAKRDVQVIPAYLNYLLKTNEFLSPEMFGHVVLTKTSIVRQMATKQIGNNHLNLKSGKKVTITRCFEWLCKKELPPTFDSYALRKACFRGGLTFTSANYAQKVFENVASLDVTSMHHAFICGRYIPVNFHFVNSKIFKNDIVEEIVETKLSDVLKDYHKPFRIAGHFRIEFKNLRLKQNSCFEKWGISILAQSKFDYNAIYESEHFNKSKKYAESECKKTYIDYARNFEFAFGKLIEAKKCILHLNEVELWTLAQVYEWDKFKCIECEVTRRFYKAPDFVTLQSCKLYKMKNDLKKILKTYKENEKYEGIVSNTIPSDLAILIKNGAVSNNFLESYYNSTIKGMFNGIYGTQAQDIFKPSYFVDEDGEISIDDATKINKDNFDIKDIKTKVLYTYGMRIVAGSRMHLIIAIDLLWKKLKSKIDILGGDTDSLKIRCDADINDNVLLKALKPLHNAITKAINFVLQRVKNKHTKLYSDLKNVGCFECENKNNFYKKHMEYWNKARISLKNNNKIDLTCAGLPRPSHKYNIVDFANELIKKYDFDTVASLIIGFNTFIKPEVAQYLQKRRPKFKDVFNAEITDYKGNKATVITHEAISLYNSGRWLGEEFKFNNRFSIEYLKKKGRKLDLDEKYIELIDNKPVITINRGDRIEQIL